MILLTNTGPSIPQEAWIIMAVGYMVVFLALVLLYAVFANLPKLIGILLRRSLRKAGKHSEAAKKDISVSGEVNAAISAALYLYFTELHDEELAVITQKKVSKTYSPWSSKLYNMNPIFIRRRR